jgi:hypothetical protein
MFVIINTDYSPWLQDGHYHVWGEFVPVPTSLPWLSAAPVLPVDHKKQCDIYHQCFIPH